MTLGSISFNALELLFFFTYSNLAIVAIYHILNYGLFDIYGSMDWGSGVYFYYLSIGILGLVTIILDTIDLIKNRRNDNDFFIFLIHHFLIIICTTMIVFSSEFKFGAVLYFTELSTPLLLFRDKMKEQKIRGLSFDILSLFFGITFIFCRLIVAPIPTLYNLVYVVPYNSYYGTMTPTHTLMTFTSLVLLGMNINWGRIIIRNIIKVFNGKDSDR